MYRNSKCSLVVFNKVLYFLGIYSLKSVAVEVKTERGGGGAGHTQGLNFIRSPFAL